MAMDPEALYQQVGRLIETMPDLTAFPTPADTQRWLGRADALMGETGDVTDRIEFRAATAALLNIESLQQILYRVLGSAELKAPARARGTFIPVGNSFDAFAALSKVLQTATADVLIVDPYMDATALTDFAGAVASGVMLRLLSDKATRTPTLEPAAIAWVTQYGATHPLQVRLAPSKALHDRAILIDKTTAWTLTQSLKDFAKRSPAEIVRADDIAALKVDAYEEIWDRARIVV
jgi:hypothetical protein